MNRDGAVKKWHKIPSSYYKGQKNATRGELHSWPRVVFNDWGILKHSLFSKGSSLFRFY